MVLRVSGAGVGAFCIRLMLKPVVQEDCKSAEQGEEAPLDEAGPLTSHFEALTELARACARPGLWARRAKRPGAGAMAGRGRAR